MLLGAVPLPGAFAFSVYSYTPNYQAAVPVSSCTPAPSDCSPIVTA
jgi:hypothetical protein